MVGITFRYSDGRERRVDVPAGQSIMEAAVRTGVEGIDADCGGALSCATCHVWVDEPWASMLPVRSQQENDMLEFAIGVRDTSRLSCQIVAHPALDGLTVEVPPTQK